MTDRDFKHLDPLVPERDDRIGSRDRPKDRPAAAGARKDSPKAENPSSSGGGIWKLLVALLIAGLAGGGWFTYQIHQQLTSLQASFDSLEGKIISTDESLSQSGAAISVTLKEHSSELTKQWSEIKKLWGVSYDTNRKTIAENKAALAKQTADAKSIRSSLASQKKLVSTATAKANEANRALESLTSSSLSVRLHVEEAVEQLQASSDRLNRLEQSQKQSQSDLNRRLAETEDAIRAIDADRRRVNQDLLQIKQRLNQP